MSGKDSWLPAAAVYWPVSVVNCNYAFIKKDIVENSFCFVYNGAEVVFYLKIFFQIVAGRIFCRVIEP